MATPQLVQHVDMNLCDGPAAPGTPGDTVYLGLGEKTLSGNALIVFLEFNYSAAAISSVTDNAGNSYTLVGSIDDSNGEVLACYAKFNFTAGATLLEVAFNGPPQWVGIKFEEWTNVTGVDTYTTYQQGSNSTTILAASSSSKLTPTQTGDLILMAAWNMSFSTWAANPATFSVGSQANITWAFSNCSINALDDSAEQYGVYNSTTAFQPQMTSNVSTTWTAMAVALKVGSQGSAPGSQMRIAGIQHMYLDATSSNSNTTQLPTQGNLCVCLSTSGDGISSITSTGTNTASWTSRISEVDAETYNFYAQILDSVNTSAGVSTITINFSAHAAGAHNVILLDVVGAATAPYDTSAGTPTQTQSSGSTLPITWSGHAYTIQPSTSNGIVVCCVGINQGELTSLSSPPTGAWAIACYDNSYTTGGDRDMDEDNGFCICHNSGTSQLTFTFNNYYPPAVDWSAAAVSYEAPALGGQVPYDPWPQAGPLLAQ